MQKCTYWRHCV